MGRPATLLLALLLAACARPAGLVRLDGLTMGTTWSAQFAPQQDLDPRQVRAAIEAELDEVVAQMSTWRQDSDISRYNDAPAGSWHELPAAFAGVLAAALALAEASDGYYDPTVGPLVELWGFGASGPRSEPPAEDEIATARAQVGWQRLRFDPGDRLLQPGGVRLDLSSIAEGYAVDRMGQALERLGSHDYLVEIGGELRARGRRPDGTPWRVAIEHPDTGAAPSVVLVLQDQAIATSGDYRRHFEHDGRRYGHAIDPHTGWPVAHGLAAVTVVAPDCMHAGSLASALSVLGPRRGMDFALRHGIAARMLVRGEEGDLQVLETPAFSALPRLH